ncbi:MAG: beta-ketoacyl-[acyl-carrier-protein] synthase family protein [Verrucomicrobiales bacterium]|nr:beta-ketoacyl-[acyl-carrier-protein] synthase family protein [Verrucomicrobiales bacterium]
MPDALAITGMGVWSAGGTSPEALHQSALKGGPLGAFQIPERPEVAACVAPPPEGLSCFPQIHRMDRSAQLALAAALGAHRQAQLEHLDPTRIGILVGNSRGPAGLWSTPAVGRLRPTRAAHSAVASLSGALSLALRARGPCLTISATCASAAHAIAVGAGMIHGGLVDAVLVGGAEAPLAPPLLDQFAAAGILGHGPSAEEVCRPFDIHRNGTIPGEGAGFLVLETVSTARSRGVGILARLVAATMGAESHNRVAARPDGDGLAQVMTQALAAAGIEPSSVAYVNAHGTGTRVNDAAEAAALRRIFGDHVGALPVSSTKAITGHTFGAAAALEAVISIQSLRTGIAPPTTGCLQPDPTFGLDVVVASPRPIAKTYAMSNSLGFWGNTASLIFALGGA